MPSELVPPNAKIAKDSPYREKEKELVMGSMVYGSMDKNKREEED